MNKATIGITGFGRFGKTLHRLFEDTFSFFVYDPYIASSTSYKNIVFCNSAQELYSSAKTVFLAVPIPQFESIINEQKAYFDDHLLIDVSSVKVHPCTILQEAIKGTTTRFILTHPMFGPDSSKNGFDGLPLVIYNQNATDEEYTYWKDVFESHKLALKEMNPEEHDKLAAYSQGLAHLLGRTFEKLDLKNTIIDTKAAKMLVEIRNLTCNDSWELFEGLQKYNPYAKRMRSDFKIALEEIFTKLE